MIDLLPAEPQAPALTLPYGVARFCDALADMIGTVLEYETAKRGTPFTAVDLLQELKEEEPCESPKIIARHTNKPAPCPIGVRNPRRRAGTKGNRGHSRRGGAVRRGGIPG